MTNSTNAAAPFLVLRGRFCRLDFTLLLGALLCAVNGVAWGESGILVLHVKDVQRHPILDIQIGVEGDGGSAITSDDGKARISLAKQTKEKSWVSLQILKSPHSKDFVILSPWDYRVLVPSFENESENFVEVVVVQRGHYAEAEPLFQHALTILEDSLGPDHPRVATTLNNLASLLQNRRQYELAETLFRRALAIHEKALAPDHPDVAMDMDNLGSLLQAKGDLAAAEPLMRRALAIYQEKLGPDHPDVARSLNNLAELMEAKGDFATAEPLLRRALEINRNTFGLDQRNSALF